MRPIAKLLFLFALGCSMPGKAQNLVPNEGFETYNSCPNNLLGIPYSPGYNDFPYLLNWTNPVKKSTPDFLHTCATAGSGLRVPNSSFGYQQPHSGNAYAGIIAWEGQYAGSSLIFDYREYLQTRLLAPLQAGHHYCVSFYVSPTIGSATGLNHVYIDELGVNLSAVKEKDTINYNISLPYTIKSSQGSFLNDSSKWVKISGSFTAVGGEQWLTIGCFKSGTGGPAFIPAYPLSPNPVLDYRAYFFIDDIAVREVLTSDSVFASRDSFVCLPTGLSLNLEGMSGALGYEWNTGASTHGIVIGDTGTYWCRAEKDCGITVDTFHIRYKPSPKLSLGPDTVNCNSQPIVLMANHAYDSYSWTGGANTSSFTAQQSGSYILTVIDRCGAQKDTVEVAIQDPTEVPLVHDTVICQMTSNPQISVTGTNILWYPMFNMFSGQTQQPSIPTMQCGTQVIYVTQTVGKCESEKVPVNIRIKYKPNANIGNYYSICYGEDTVIGQEYAEVNYLWNTNEMTCCIQPHETGTYQLTISNNCGTSSDTAFVEFSACEECLLVPNAFTPNRDGKNDVFLPILKCPVRGYRLRIYNRWGELVFASADPTKGWDGAYLNDFSDLGVYVYEMEYISETAGSFKHIKGNLTLIR